MRRTILAGSLVLFAAVIYAYLQYRSGARLVLVGMGNRGKIAVYSRDMKKIREIDTGYRFVHTVRLGTIGGRQMIVAGVSNSFFSEPYGCSVIAYPTATYKKETVDAVGDLRCKDLTFGDADNDGNTEILAGTHGRGIVRMYKSQGISWRKENLEYNYIAKIDKETGTNHQVPAEEITCGGCEDHTAVHIVKVADVDNDGKNEVIVTMSSPLELKNVEEISFIRLYKRSGSGWKSTTVDSLQDREFRSIAVGDIYHTGKNVLVVGIGSPRKEKGSLVSYRFAGGRWDKRVIYADADEQNMKGTAVVDFNGSGAKQILLATGYPKAKVMLLDWDGNKFAIRKINTVADMIKMPGAQYNAMAVSVLQEQPPRFVVAGMSTFPQQNIGWEGTDKGFTILYEAINGQWSARTVDNRSALALD